MARAILSLIIGGFLITIGARDVKAQERVDIAIVQNETQQIAELLDLPERFNIRENPSAQNFLEYYAFLVSSEEVAREIRQSGQSEAFSANLLLGFWTLCWFPPNKPPSENAPTEDVRASALVPAVFSAEFRSLIRENVGSYPEEIIELLNESLPPRSQETVLALRSGDVDIDEIRDILQQPPTSEVFSWEWALAPQ